MRALSSERWQQVAGTLVRRTPRSVLLSVPGSDQPVRIEGAAACVWESLSTPRDIATLAAAVTGVSPPPADLADDIARTVDALVGAGLLAPA